MLIDLVCKSHEMKRTSRGGGRVRTNLNESHEMRRNWEKFSWDLKVLKIPRYDEIPRDFSPMLLLSHPLYCYIDIYLPGHRHLLWTLDAVNPRTNVYYYNLTVICSTVHFAVLGKIRNKTMGKNLSPGSTQTALHTFRTCSRRG